jgi:hypothetical protein
MVKKNVRNRKETKGQKSMVKSNIISYRLKCAKTANGLTHFVMYGDVPKKQMPL